MKINLLIFLSAGLAFAQSYPPPAGQEGSTAIYYDSDLFVAWATGVDLTRGHVDITDPELEHNGSNYASYGSPADALGIADNMVVSLGDAGVAVLTFDRPIGNGDGYDFAVFENAFNDTFLEIAFVEVSSDGENFFRFPSHSETQTETQVGGFGSLDATYLNNFAGKYRAFFGTPFDLDELEENPLLNKNSITHVKVVDVVGTIDPQYATYDSYGNKVNDPFPTPFYSSGFDLDAVGVINEGSLSVSEIQVAKVSIYPNPAKDIFFVKTEGSFNLKIYDLNGRVVQSKSGINHNQAIDISSLKTGIYMVEIQTQHKKTIHKLIVN